MNNEESLNLLELENFILDTDGLEEIEALQAQFNVFSVLNIIHAEIRHSSVIAWLLDPEETHKLGDRFLKDFLKSFVKNNKDSLSDLITLIDIELLDFTHVEVKREWRNIDISLLIKTNKDSDLVIAIENKIKAKESETQLSTYHKVIDDNFSTQTTKLFIYLTPDGEPASNGNEDWLSYTYSDIATILENILSKYRNSISDNIYDFINQYSTNLRRHIVGNSEIENICKRLYEKHSKALDLIFEYKPDIQYEINQHLKKQIGSTDNFTLETSTKSNIRFTTISTTSIKSDNKEGWIESNRILVYEFRNNKDSLKLTLLIGPGNEVIRKRLLEFAKQKSDIFKTRDKLSNKFHTILSIDILKKEYIENKTQEEVLEKIDEEWQNITTKCESIDNLIKDEFILPNHPVKASKVCEAV